MTQHHWVDTALSVTLAVCLGPHRLDDRMNSFATALDATQKANVGKQAKLCKFRLLRIAVLGVLCSVNAMIMWATNDRLFISDERVSQSQRRSGIRPLRRWSDLCSAVFEVAMKPIAVRLIGTGNVGLRHR